MKSLRSILLFIDLFLFAISHPDPFFVVIQFKLFLDFINIFPQYVYFFVKYILVLQNTQRNANN